MGWLRWLGRLAGGGLLAVLLVPSLAAWPSSLLDRGPGGSVRVSAFPLALASLDPFVWTCARNSALVASVATGLSMGLGVGLGSIAGRWRSLVIAPMAAGPMLIAAGLASTMGEGGVWSGPAGALARWTALVWTGLAIGTPLVALATLAGLRRVDPSWSEAALAVGASPRRAWRDVVWPNLRPGVARASALAFTLTLVEPAGPLVLGLDRTLAVQIVRAATRLDQPTRAATLALLAIAIALVGRAAIAWWGGPAHPRSERPDSDVTPAGGLRRGAIPVLILAGWGVLTVGTVGLWLWRASRMGGSSGVGSWSGRVEGWLADPEMATWFANLAMTAGLAVAVDLLILGFLSARGPRPVGLAPRLACRLFEAVPPLAMGVGALATPWLLLALADSLGMPMAAGWLRRLALELGPGRSPGWLLALVLAAGPLPMLVEAARLAGSLARPSRVDASRLMGLSDARAARGGRGWNLGGVPVASALLAFAMASTSLAPALLLTPFSERRTLAPAVLGFLLEPGPLEPRALGPIAGLIGLNLLALALASKGPPR